jgi:hypothetical protein
MSGDKPRQESHAMLYYRTNGKSSVIFGIFLILLGLLMIGIEINKHGLAINILINGFNGFLSAAFGVYTLLGKNVFLGNPEIINGQLKYTDFGKRVEVNIRDSENVVIVNKRKIKVISLGAKRPFIFPISKRSFILM